MNGVYKRFLPEQIDKSHPLSLDLFHKLLIKVSYAMSKKANTIMGLAETLGSEKILKNLPVKTHRPQFDLLGEMTIQPKMEDFEEFLSSEELLDFRKRLLKLGLISLSYEPHLLPEDTKEIFEYLFGEYDSYICGLVPLIEYLLQDEQKIYVINEVFLNSISNQTYKVHPVPSK